MLDQIDEISPSCADLAFELERVFRVPVTMNLYVTWGEVEGFNVHWDDHDVFVLQLTGSKRWRIFSPTRMWPLQRDSHAAPAPNAEPLADLEIEPGHLLYLPHGWWHVANAQADPSMHLTISLKQSSAIELLGYVIDRLRLHEVIRERIPTSANRDHRRRYLDTIRDLAMEVLATNTIIDEYVRNFEVNRDARLGTSLPISTGSTDDLGPNDRVFTLLVPLARLDTSAESAVLAAAGRQWRFAPMAAPVLHALVKSRHFTVSSLMATPENELSENQVRSMLREFAKAGIVCC